MAKVDIYNWDDIDLLCQRLAGMIKEPFDIIVCILRGGAIPGVILANALNIDRVATIKVVQNGQVTGVGTGAGAYAAETGTILIPLNDIDLAEKRVLVVDDVLDSGESARRVLMEIRNRGAALVKLATLQVKTYSSFEPDYFVEKTFNWIFYPWMSSRELVAMKERIAAKAPLLAD